jgi:hypothetical protein
MTTNGNTENLRVEKHGTKSTKAVGAPAPTHIPGVTDTVVSQNAASNSTDIKVMPLNTPIATTMVSTQTSLYRTHFMGDKQGSLSIEPVTTHIHRSEGPP